MNFTILCFLKSKLAHTIMTNQRVKSIQHLKIRLCKSFSHQCREVNGELRDTDEAISRRGNLFPHIRIGKPLSEQNPQRMTNNHTNSGEKFLDCIIASKRVKTFSFSYSKRKAPHERNPSSSTTTLGGSIEAKIYDSCICICSDTERTCCPSVMIIWCPQTEAGS